MFFGWRVVGGSFIVMLTVLGFFTYTFTLFVVPLREEFGVGLEQVMYSLTLGTLLSLLVGPVTGYLVDHFSVRILMTLGTALFAASLYAMSRTTTILEFNLVYGTSFAVCNGLAGPVTTSAVVSRWFLRSRGRALGIMTIGSSAGGMLLPAVTAWWISSFGWRGAFENLALMSAVAVPLVWLSIRNKPSDLGLAPDGESAAAHTENPGPTAEPPGMKQIVSTREFWLIGLSVGLLIAVFSSTLSNLSPYATGLGANEAQASSLIMVLAVLGLIGKLLFGAGADRFPLKWGMWLAQGLVGVALLIMATQPPYWVMIVAAICLGLATGGLLPVWNSMMARVFGVDSYGRAMGLMGPVITLQVMPAYIFVGRMHDAFGNYVGTLLVFAGLIFLAILLLGPVRLPEQD